MLRKLARLLFGGEEPEEAASAPEEVRSEELGEEWLVVNGQATQTNYVSSLVSTDADSAEIPSEEAPTFSDSALNATAPTKLETTSVTDPASEQSTVKSKETASNLQAISALLFPPEALQEVTKLNCLQKSRTSHHPVSRNAIQRHNRVRHGFQHHSFLLQQPARRTLGH